MVKIGLFGVGHLGLIHLSQLLDLKEFSFVGFYDPDDVAAQNAIDKYGIQRFTDKSSLIAECDALDIVTPTIYHYEIAKEVIRAGKHLFIEKPVSQNAVEAAELAAMVREVNVKCQIGHVERFNPAFIAAQPYLGRPLFIEAHRLSQFNPRGTDVSVVFDLMIHDLDIVLSIVKSDIKRISASGVKVLSDNADIANVRLEFNNGCVANITASRISLKKMRKMRIFQKDAYVSIDFLDKRSEIVRIKDQAEVSSLLDFPITLANGDKKIITLEGPEVKETNAIREELRTFADAIINDTPTKVTIDEAYAAVKLAQEILLKINNLLDE
jgi:predicted dehydrogenase